MFKYTTPKKQLTTEATFYAKHEHTANPPRSINVLTYSYISFGVWPKNIWLPLLGV